MPVVMTMTFQDGSSGVASRSLEAYAYKDGSIVTLGPHLNIQGDAEGYELLRWRGKEHGEPFRLDLESERVALFGDRLVWVSRKEDFDHLMSAALTLGVSRMSTRTIVRPLRPFGTNFPFGISAYFVKCRGWHSAGLPPQ